MKEKLGPGLSDKNFEVAKMMGFTSTDWIAEQIRQDNHDTRGAGVQNNGSHPFATPGKE